MKNHGMYGANGFIFISSDKTRVNCFVDTLGFVSSPILCFTSCFKKEISFIVENQNLQTKEAE